MVELWAKKCRNLGFYEYFSEWLWDFDRLPGGNAADITRTRTVLDHYMKVGATSITAQAGNNWGVHGRGYYIANRLFWNPGANVEALLADFYDKAFGPAAAPMGRYYERLAPDRAPVISRGLVGEALRDVEEGARLAAARPDVLARLDQLKHYLRYVHLCWLLDHEADAAKKKELTVAALTLGYRTRFEYMNHWRGMQIAWTAAAAKEFSEPAWDRADASAKPWIVDTPVTHAETDQWFREALSYFQPTPVQEIAFRYDDLTPAGAAKSGSTPKFTFEKVERFAVQSRTGEPIKFEIMPGAIEVYRDGPEATWTLRDARTVTIAQGRLPLDSQPHPVAIKVPTAGIYYFEGDTKSGWRLTAPAEAVVTWLPQRGRDVVHIGPLPELFFYVPKGARQLQYFFSGKSHKIFGPDHKLIAESATDSEVFSIAVPPGADGRLWSIEPRGIHQLWFFNAPNCLATSPAALLLPRRR